jgi:N-acetylglucosaminyldiphosphoundecaprenol N-acetyl-beta-D-mannosaminyltransferase
MPLLVTIDIVSNNKKYRAVYICKGVKLFSNKTITMKTLMLKQDLFSMSFNVAPYNSFINEIVARSKSFSSEFVCVANVHMLVESFLDRNFASVVNNADIVTPDGVPITWALRLLDGIKQDRVAGMDLLPDLLSRCSTENLPVYFYGGTQTMLDKTDAFVKQNYPALNVAGMYSPPFRKLTEAEDQAVADQINASGARIVFVVLGCPKQEKWMASMKGKINAVMIGIGGALPVLVGMQKRAPKWIQNIGMEWGYRLAQDPKRLFKRYLVTNSIFIYLLLTQKAKQLIINKKPSKVVTLDTSNRSFLKKTA